MMNEPTLTRIRKVRQRISAECGHDPYKLVKYYIEFQKQYQDRLIPKKSVNQISINK
ncbi:MAG: hypothetical protein KAH84_03740 [Thiomargarita sp.]|nr:hypothetical protein [Thiomargarita sp.]